MKYFIAYLSLIRLTPQLPRQPKESRSIIAYSKNILIPLNHKTSITSIKG